MPWPRRAVAVILSAASSISARADIFSLTEATDNATVQVAGPRTGASGKSFFNLEGSVNGSFASFGVAEFTLGSLGPVNISQISLQFIEANSSFTKAGTIDFWLTSDNATSLQTGSSLHYDSTAAPDGIGTQLSSLFSLGTGNFTTTGNVNNGQVDTYTFTLNAGNTAAFNYLDSVIASGGTVRAVTSPGTSDVAATWAGTTNATASGPEISFQYSIVPEPTIGSLVLAGLGVAAARRRRRAIDEK